MLTENTLSWVRSLFPVGRMVALIVFAVVAVSHSVATCQTDPQVAAATVPGQTSADQQPVARGRVFLDENRDRKLDATERGLAGVRVSNGREIVLTDASGSYELPVAAGGAIFVIKPRGFMTPVNELNLPRFFYLHKPDGSPPLNFPGVAPTGPLPQSIDFPLHQQEEPDSFEVILFGDPQPRDVREVDYIAHDVVRDLVGSQAAFGVTLGDIVFDDLSVMQPLNETVALIGVPWYNVIGNHDINKDVTERSLINETFERHYGPSYYSYDYGQVHFVVMDNIGWGIAPDQPGQYRFRPEFGPDQLEFLKRDLELLPPEQMVVLMMHVPLFSTSDTQELFRLIEQRPLCISFAAHTHNHTHVFFDQATGWQGDQPHHHMVNVTVSGSWWSGKTDERGIPHTMMTDGAPNGHSILRFDGTEYSLDFVAAGVDAGDQMRIMLPETVDSSATATVPLYVNVYNGSSRSKVEFRIDQSEVWKTLTQVQEEDPDYKRLHVEDQAHAIFGGHRLNKPSLSSHLWRGTLDGAIGPGVHLVEVRTTDMRGREYLAHRSLRVTGDASPATGAGTAEPGAAAGGER